MSPAEERSSLRARARAHRRRWIGRFVLAAVLVLVGYLVLTMLLLFAYYTLGYPAIGLAAHGASGRGGRPRIKTTAGPSVKKFLGRRDVCRFLRRVSRSPPARSAQPYASGGT